MNPLRARRYLICWIGLGAGAVNLAWGSADPARSSPFGRSSIADFGARPSPDVAVTQEIQQAVESCHAQGGGTVVIPAGVYVSGTIYLKSGVYLELEPGAQLLGSTRIDDYPAQPTPAYRSLKDSAPFRALIYAENESNIGVVGEGTIDGRGASFKWGGSDLEARPRLIQFVSCHGVRVEGLHLRNSGMWMQHYLNCEEVQIRGLNVWNHSNHNNDMMDIDGCRQVTVSDCVGDTDDDAITLKSTGLAPCQNVVITNCVVSSHCNAIKCGTETTGGFQNIVISNCVVKPSSGPNQFGNDAKGITGIALEIVDGGTMDGVIVSNVAITGTRSAIFVRLGNRARKHRADAPVPGIGVIRNVRIENIFARGVGDIGSSITGLPGHPIENLTLRDVQIELASAGQASDATKQIQDKEKAYPEGTMWGRLPAYGFYVRHAVGLRMDNVSAIPAQGEARPQFAEEDVKRVVAQ